MCANPKFPPVQLMKMIVECPEELVEPETIALGINLACSPRNAQFMVKGPGLKLLMRRGLQDSGLSPAQADQEHLTAPGAHQETISSKSTSNIFILPVSGAAYHIAESLFHGSV